MKLIHAYSLSAVGLAAAQVNPYGQCGGQNWSGETTCVSGWTCHYYNEWYSQCIPGSDNSSSSSTTTSKPSGTPTTTTSISIPSSTNFPSVDGLNFNIDGETNYFAGTNTYWIAFLTKNSDVDLVLDHMQASGLKILRIWGFNDVNSVPSSGTVYFQLHQNGQSTINTGADGLQRLDYVVAAAASRGIKLIINFVNYWDDYGGIQAYINNYGGSKTTWYTDSNSQAAYKNYIKTVVSRYKGSSSVFAWELANEPRCQGCNTSVLYNWMSSTSAYIKSLEPDRMVCTGDEGFGLATGSDGSYPYTYAEGLDFEKNLGISTIDFGTLHLYPSSWGTSYNWGSLWISAHGEACAAAGKPCVLEEYGATSDHCTIEAPWQKTALSSNGIAADMFWQYGDTLSTGQSPNDRNTIYYGSSDYTCLVTDHVADI